MKRQKSILIIEDEKEIGENIYNLIHPFYEEVQLCLSPHEAEELIKKRSFSVILSDILMPGLPGHELIKVIRGIGRIEPVIFITGHASHDVLLTAVRLGVFDIIEKPFNDSDVLKSIERALEIEKRKLQLYEKSSIQKDSSDHFINYQKMIGLLQVANTKKLKCL